MEVSPGGGSEQPELDSTAEGALFVLSGELGMTLDGRDHLLKPGGFAFIPPASNWTLRNSGTALSHFHWIRKSYEAIEGIDRPRAFVVSENEIDPYIMPDTQQRWATTRFFDQNDISYDMHVTINTFWPGTILPFAETHVMEHGLFVLEGKGIFYLNQDWIEAEAGDFMWLRAFCPQACYAAGPDRLRYLLYKDVNRHACLSQITRS